MAHSLILSYLTYQQQPCTSLQTLLQLLCQIIVLSVESIVRGKELLLVEQQGIGKLPRRFRIKHPLHVLNNKLRVLLQFQVGQH